MRRAKTVQNLYAKKHTEYEFDSIWREAMGNPDTAGAWIIYGPEKNGKTRFTILLADYLSRFNKVFYVPAEEGIAKDFVSALKWANVSPANNNLQFEEYEPVAEIQVRLKKRNGPRIVIIDNLTFYRDEIDATSFKKLLQDNPGVLFIFLAHEERGEPYTAIAKLVKKRAKIIVRVEGLACVVSGRCPGGRLIIDEQRALLYHGQQVLNAS